MDHLGRPDEVRATQQARKPPRARGDANAVLVSTVGKSGLPALRPQVGALSLERADELRARAPRRTDIPLRAAFVRQDEPDAVPPLAALVRTGGRGAAVPLKLYLGIVWLASAPPFDVPPLSPRVWAELLDLQEPSGRGKRRITAGLTKLEEHGLIAVERRRGEASKVRLLLEDGSGRPYSAIPSTDYVLGSKKSRQRYIKLNTRLWTRGHIQSMSAKALAMLLVILEEQYGQDQAVWFSEKRFAERFNLSRDTRSEGARELFQRELIVIRRVPVTNSGAAFEREANRNTYQVIGDAIPSDWDNGRGDPLRTQLKTNVKRRRSKR